MTHRHLNLPEPTLPEHELIRAAMPMPELSSGFRSRVMKDCSTSIVIARRNFRWKVAAVLAAVCCLAVTLSFVLPPNSESSPDVVEQPEPTLTPGMSLGSHGLAVDQSHNGPSGGGEMDSERRDINEILDELKGRQRMFDASMLPRL
ncbi:MAG: hypothetical protein KDA81_07095 [Planctomycetaceae bacterium]|nr:hypothetical protein [Planctomycetaceae bacterium]MCA9083803.1 hypothetical protein [Planctomycetaceae bacterium]